MLIFDLDGTLYRTHETTLPAFEGLCKQYGISLAEEDKRYLMVTTTRSFLRRAAPELPEEKQVSFQRELRHRELQAVRERGRLFDHVEEMLTSLVQSGEELAICGMGSQEYIETVLNHCKIRQYFKYVSYRIGDRTKGEALRQLLCDADKTADQCVLIGDSGTDWNAAKENRMAFIGVTYGYGFQQVAQADFLAETVTQLESLIHYARIYLRISREIRCLAKPAVVGINGVDTSGKTVFAQGLERFLRSQGVLVQTVHLDDFHNPREIRGRDRSPEGYLKYAFDFGALADLLSCGKNSPKTMTRTLLDLDQDTYTKEKTFCFTRDTVILVEGVMLFRPPLCHLLDYKVFLQIPFEEVLKRAAQRDVPKYGEAFLEQYRQRYIPAQKLYLNEFLPVQQAQLVVDNTDFSHPVIM